MRITIFSLSIFLLTAVVCMAQDQGLLLDDFENQILGGPDGTVDFGSGNGSSVEVTAETELKHLGNQSLKVTFTALSGGYIWVARGFGLDASNAGWQVSSEGVDWQQFNSFSFYVYGSDSKAKIAFDLKDSGNEMFRFIFEDNFKGWGQVNCPFKEFFARSDWQPDNAAQNTSLDFPIKSFQFEPLPEAEGILYFDSVELLK